MLKVIKTPFGNIQTFSLFSALGILFMLFLLHSALKKEKCETANEENYIFQKIVVSGVFGFLSSAVFDSIVKYNRFGNFKLHGITFYGGFLGAVLCFFVLVTISLHKTSFSVKAWFDLLTCPFIGFHFFGRIGCFFAGCCYGKQTNSLFAVSFPDDVLSGIYHYGKKCYPTQLFEAFLLLIIFLVVSKCKNKFFSYTFLYAVARFFVEFFRGDERGYITGILSPSQTVCIGILCVCLIYKLFTHIFKGRSQS